MQNAISLSQQYKYFQEYISKLTKIAGRKNASFIIGDALYLIGTGTADFMQNYYLNPKIRQVYTTTDHYSSHLVDLFVKFIKVIKLFLLFFLFVCYIKKINFFFFFILSNN